MSFDQLLKVLTSGHIIITQEKTGIHHVGARSGTQRRVHEIASYSKCLGFVLNFPMTHPHAKMLVRPAEAYQVFGGRSLIFAMRPPFYGASATFD